MLSRDAAARIIQRAVRRRIFRRSHLNEEALRRQELSVAIQRHRAKLDAHEREFNFLSRLPAEAVLQLSLQKVTRAAILIQAFWRGLRVRRRIEEIKLEYRTVPRRTQRIPKQPDDFYKPITEERRTELIKQLRLRGGTGDHEEYLREYCSFLERQVAWEAQRLKKADFNHEVRSMLKSLCGVKGLTDSLAYVVENPTPEEKAVARETFKQRVPDPKRWWKALERDWEWQAVGGNIIEEVERYKLDLYRSRNMKYAGM
mmetsp:Transcript_2068/g.4750  ORF Transcript_2068/g.4750 Transcript_2068/m.4750 type:complete len:258 (+) Transcript_2068:1879-2652(+)